MIIIRKQGSDVKLPCFFLKHFGEVLNKRGFTLF